MDLLNNDKTTEEDVEKELEIIVQTFKEENIYAKETEEDKSFKIRAWKWK